MVSRKCQYAIRAVFELARRHGVGPVKISEIAAEQAIPMRFLEVILNQLRRAGFVESRRGASGGYSLARHPEGITVGEVIRFVEGPLAPVACMTDERPAEACALTGRCVFLGLWERVARAVSDVYDRTTFQSLLDEELRMRQDPAGYSI